ncbi:hypothetical protein KQI52_09275 [bacterium]|nr:hypothetical protein [bacterium]
MSTTSDQGGKAHGGSKSRASGAAGNGLQRTETYYRHLLKTTLLRLLLMYFVPLLLLAGFFHLQQLKLMRESRRAHLQSIAEHQAYMLDLFLRERIVNLENVIDDPRLPVPPSNEVMERRLAELRKTSDTFVDIGWFSTSGNLLAYAGPHPDLESRNYGMEAWFLELRGSAEQVVITDIYMGFREQPHFTIAVNRIIDGRYVVLRAVLSPERMREYLTTLQHNEQIVTSLLSKDGSVQVVAGRQDPGPVHSAIVPPRDPWIGTGELRENGSRTAYAYAWLRATPWALLVEGEDVVVPTALLGGAYSALMALIGAILVIEFLVIIYRARVVVRKQRRTDAQSAELSGQLVHAAKLATVGELAAGIAHEINNPLAIIAEETGLVRDLMDPRFGRSLSPAQLNEHLDIIHQATFRCRDITRKLLGFVRQESVNLGEHDVRQILDNVVDGLLGREFELSGIRVVKDYSPHVPEITTDRHLLEQVFLNLVKNAYDAMDGTGTLTLHVSATPACLSISVSDTGSGIPPELLEKIFMPFYTTKEVGKGTGLGLSVSFGIIKSLQGNIYVDSKPGVGSMFTVELPVVWKSSARTSDAGVWQMQGKAVVTEGGQS